MSKDIPVDPDVKIGTLKNGLKYYIRKNAKPENRAEFRLAVNAGSVLEDESQRGLAHFVEHMAFNGSEHFKKNELVNVLERMGVKFGAELNAYTSFDETVYMLSVPTDQQGLVDTAFLILKDWASALDMEGEEIDKERGVIHEEWRLGLGANDRMQKKNFPKVFAGSLYAERIPIGLMSVVDKAPYERLRTFYSDWYRPDLQAIVVVGNIDVDKMEKQIKSTFGSLKNPTNERERKVFTLPGNDKPIVAIATDPEASRAIVKVIYKEKGTPVKTYGDLRKKLVKEIYTGMLSQRLQEISQTPESPYNYAVSFYSRYYLRELYPIALFAISKNDDVNKTLQTLLRENERAARFGYTTTEFDRYKEDLLVSYETAAKEYDKANSGNLAMEYVANYLSNNMIPSDKDLFEIIKEILPTISLKDVNEVGSTIDSDKNVVVEITAPETESVKVPTEADVLNDIKMAKEEKLEAYVDNVSSEPLLDVAKVKAGKVVKTEENKKFGITTFELSNGVKVVMKPTDYKNDEILISGYAKGGTSLYSKEMFPSALSASEIVGESGLGNFDQIQLNKQLAGKNISIFGYIGSISEGYQGSASPKDFETFLQTLYLNFTAPRKDEKAYQTYISNITSYISNLKANPQYYFKDTLSKVIYNNDIRHTVIATPDFIKQINLDDAFKVYKETLGDASGFTFTIVGNFKVNEIKPLIEKYMASLPSSGKKREFKDLEDKFPKGVTKVEVYKGKEQKSSVKLKMNSKFKWNQKERFALRVFSDVLSIKLRENLREDKGGVYGVGAYASASAYPKPEVNLTVSFGTGPEHVEKLVDAVFEEINKIKKDGATDDDLNKVKKTLLRGREKNLKNNRFWLHTIQAQFSDDIGLTTYDEYEKLINGITSKDIKKMAKKYINTKNYVLGILNPEK
ncbi:MAG: M16 family metallopeptidase [Hyphomicrobiales bacterium]